MKIRALLLAVALAFSVLPGRAVGLDGETVARGLQTWLDGTRDLRCRFEQTLVSGTFGSDAPESGTLLLLRPGRMRWDYTKPEAKVALLQGTQTSVYLPDDRQLIRGQLTEEAGGLHALLAGTGRIQDLFAATLVTPKGEARSKAVRLRLVPREETESFQAVLLDLAAKTFEIEAAEVFDPAGNVIRYRFSGLRRNQGIPEDAFHLEPPPGTEIIDAR